MLLTNSNYKRKTNSYNLTLIIAENVDIAYVKKKQTKKFVKLRTEKKSNNNKT
jgi:hypothetical protein